MAASLPSLPPELQLLVVQHSISPPSLTDYSSRYSTLRSYSLVCRTWRDWAQAELFRSVALPTRASGRILAKVLEEASHLGERTRELRLGTINVDPPTQSAAGFKLRQLLSACPRLRDLRIVTVRRVDLKDVALVSSTLTSLFLSNCSITAFEPFPTSFNWPHLRWMCVLDSKIFETYSHLTTTSFPSLSSLSWSHNDVHQNQRPVDDLDPPFLDSPALKSLSVSSPIPSSLIPNGLVFLDCPISKLKLQHLPRLPTSLRTLRLAYSDFVTPGIIQADVKLCLRSLRDGRAIARTWEELQVPAGWERSPKWGQLERKTNELGIRLVKEEEMAGEYLRGERNVESEEEEFDGPFWTVVKTVERRLDEQQG